MKKELRKERKGKIIQKARLKEMLNVFFVIKGEILSVKGRRTKSSPERLSKAGSFDFFLDWNG